MKERDYRKLLLILLFGYLFILPCLSQRGTLYHNSDLICNSLYKDSLHTEESGLKSSYLKSDELVKIRRIDLIDSFYNESYVSNIEGLTDNCIVAIANECNNNSDNHSLHNLYSDIKLSSILLIDEWHIDPDNILLVLDILDSLKQVGFDHIALDNLKRTDTLLNERQYPIQKSFIRKLANPLWAYFLRYAMHSGYKIDAVQDTDTYISHTDSLGNYRRQSVHDPHKFFEYQNPRPGICVHNVDSIFEENIIAQNINDILTHYPRSRIIVIGDHDRTSVTPDMAGGILLRDFKRNVWSLDQLSLNSKTLEKLGLYDSCRNIKYFKESALGTICNVVKDRYDGHIVSFPVKSPSLIPNDIYGYGNLHGEFCGKKLNPDIGSLVLVYDYEEYKIFKDEAIPLDAFEFSAESGYKKRKYDVSKKVIVLYQQNKIEKQEIINE